MPFLLCFYCIALHLAIENFVIFCFTVGLKKVKTPFLLQIHCNPIANPLLFYCYCMVKKAMCFDACISKE